MGNGSTNRRAGEPTGPLANGYTHRTPDFRGPESSLTGPRSEAERGQADPAEASTPIGSFDQHGQCNDYMAGGARWMHNSFN